MNHTLSAVTAAVAVIFAASWTLHAQTPAHVPGTPAEQIADLMKRVAALEKRSMALEQAASGSEQQPTKTAGTAPPSNANSTVLEQRPSSRVKAPFEVVDDAGKVVFRVLAEPRSFSLLTPAGQTVATGSFIEGGGFLKATAADGSTEVVMGVNGKTFTGVTVRQGGKPRGVFGLSASGKSGLLQLSSDSGAVGSTLGVSQYGGTLQLSNSGGYAQVEAGVLSSSGAGIVRTFPNGNPGAGLVGMPGTFIMGRGGK